VRGTRRPSRSPRSIDHVNPVDDLSSLNFPLLNRLDLSMLLPVASPFIDALFWVAVACCVFAQLAIVRSVLRAGARASVPHEADARDPGLRPLPRSRRVMELLWVLIPALGLAAVLVATWRTMPPRI
jgi:heme/copper-type cytochrome/quinol oxidase subunit 2